VVSWVIKKWKMRGQVTFFTVLWRYYG